MKAEANILEHMLTFQTAVSQKKCFCGCCKHHGQSSSGRQDFIWLPGPHHSLSRREVRAGPWRQELTQRIWRGAACWLALQGMLRLLSYTTQDTCPEMAHINHQPWKCPKRLSHRPFWWRNFSQPMFPFPRWPSGCQVDQKLTSTGVTWQPSLL